MKTVSIFRSIADAFREQGPSSDVHADIDSMGGGHSGLWQQMTGQRPDILGVSEEVAAEQSTCIAMLCRSADMGRLVLSYLRQQPLEDDGEMLVREGAWILVTLPEFGVNADEDQWKGTGSFAPHNGQAHFEEFEMDNADWHAPYGLAGELLDLVGQTGAEVLLYLADGRQGWQDGDAQWCARLRTMGVPLLPVLITVVGQDGVDGIAFDERHAEQLRWKLAIQPVVLTVQNPPVLADALPDEPPSDVVELTVRLLSVRAKVAIPLAQDIAWCRHTIAARMIRTGSLMTALVGIEPIPLLDLPLHVALHWKVALQLAAIHGRPGLDIRSREMVGTIGLNLCMRTIAQQLIKLIPVVGWILSGVLSGLSTFFLGHALLRYYENDQIWNWPETKASWHRQRRRMVRSVVDGMRRWIRRVRRGQRVSVETWQRPEENVAAIPILLVETPDSDPIRQEQNADGAMRQHTQTD